MRLLVRQIVHVDREAREAGVALLLEHSRALRRAVGRVGDPHLHERVSPGRTRVLELALDHHIEVDSDTPFEDARIDESALEDWQERAGRFAIHAETETWIEADQDG